MMFTVTMKTPDVLRTACADAAVEIAQKNVLANPDGLGEDQLLEQLEQELYESAEKWFKYGEYLTVLIDTDEGTCKVMRER